ncbi:MAG: hypothetical protein N2748_01940 [candidate division WOR-3 bacterium]|nr:hypothetical protein [candidate division WOR-3 bacterium]
MKKIIILLIITGKLLLAFDDKIPYFARPGGLGEAFSAVKDDAAGIFYNPAGLNIKTVNFSLTEWYFDTRAGAFAGSYNYKDLLTVGAGLVYYSYGQLQYFNDEGIAGDYFSGGYWQTKFRLSKQINKLFSIGSAFKLNYQKIDTVGKTENNFDFGILSSFQVVNVGFYVQDIKDERIWAGGIAIRPVKDLLLTSDLTYQEQVNFMAGIEYYLNPLYIRFGYNHEKKRISSGIGYKQKSYIFDYTISNHRNLGITHQFSISIK